MQFSQSKIKAARSRAPHNLIVDVLNEINTGRLRPGDRLASEQELAEAYNLSRGSVRKALAFLQRGGAVVRNHGAGTFVAHLGPATLSETAISELANSRRVRGTAGLLRLNAYEYHALARAGRLLPLDGFLRAPAGRQALDDFLPQLRPLCCSLGAVLALPAGFSPVMLFYNATAFARAGLPRPEAPWNWTAFENAIPRLAATDRNGRLVRWAIDVFAAWAPLVLGAGGELTDPARARCLLDSAESIEALRWLCERHSRLFPAGRRRREDATQGFLAGRTACLASTRCFVKILRKKADFDWNFLPFPKRRANAPSWVIVTLLAISRDSPNPRSDWDRMRRTLSAKEQMREFAAGEHYPALRSLAESNACLRDSAHPREPNRFWLEELANPCFFHSLNERAEDILNLRILYPIAGHGLWPGDDEIRRCVAEVNAAMTGTAGAGAPILTACPT